jgi:prolyl oligopeptidase
MRKISTVLLFACCLTTLIAQGPKPPETTASGVPAPPKTTVNEVKETIHGVEIVDSYRWLEDQNSPETRSWIDAENAYTDALLSHIAGKEALQAKVAALLKVEFMGTPMVRNNRYFFLHRRADQDQSQLFMRQGITGKEELLVDPLALSAEHTTTVTLDGVSHDGSLLVYGLRQGGEDETTLHIYDVNARKELADQFPRARYNSTAILPDNSGLYFVKQTVEGPRAYFHKIGSSNDQEVFGKGYGPEKILSANLSVDGRYLWFTVQYGSAATKSEIYAQDLKANGPITPIVNDLEAAFNASVGGDKMYLTTNWNAPKWRVMQVDLANPGREHWREIVPQGEAVIDGVNLIGGKLAVYENQNVAYHVKLYTTDGKFIREIKPPSIGSLSRLGGNWENPEGFYSFNSFYIPQTIYRYDAATGKQSLWFQSKVPINAGQFEVEQVMYASHDGTKIPMFVAHAKGLKLDGTHPTLLTGYGGFNVSSEPGFNPSAAAWISSGGVYALANLRGGGEFGEAWHHAGMLEKKQNVFDDFIAAAEWLIQKKYTSSDRLAIRGTSNGGLLMGAAFTQHPELFAAVICGYPLLDMVRYHKFLVARYWVPEYGSSEKADEFKYIYAYSPYHHVKAGTKYPAILFISGDSDTRVAPLHARKMTALMQASNGSDKPILLHYDTKAGHSQGTPVGKQIENITNELDFLMWQLKMTPAGAGTAGN